MCNKPFKLTLFLRSTWPWYSKLEKYNGFIQNDPNKLRISVSWAWIKYSLCLNLTCTTTYYKYIMLPMLKMWILKKRKYWITQHICSTSILDSMQVLFSTISFRLSRKILFYFIVTLTKLKLAHQTFCGHIFSQFLSLKPVVYYFLFNRWQTSKIQICL